MTKKIAIVMLTRGIGGQSIRFGYLFKYFSDNSHKYDSEIHFIVNKTKFLELKQRGIDIVLNDKVTVLNDFGKNGSFLYKLFYIYSAIQILFLSLKFDTMHFIGAAKYCMIPLAILKKLRLISTNLNITFASINMEAACYGRKKGRLSEKIFFTLADKIDCLNKNSLPSIFKNKEYVSPCSFVDVNKFLVDDTFLNKKEDIVVFVGTFDHIKQPLLLLEAIPIVHSILPTVQFYFLGSGRLLDDMEKLTHTFSTSSKNNVFIEFTYDPSNILKRSKIMCSLQQHTNYPSQSLMEAMISRNYIIATDTGDTRDILSPQFSTLLKSNDPSELASGIIQFFQLDENRQNELVDISHTFITKFSSVEKFSDYFIGLSTNSYASQN